MKINCKIAIIGGGPAGLSAAIYNARAGLEPVVFAGSPPGGQLMLTTDVENFPGTKQIMGPDLISTLRTQATSFGTKIYDVNVASIKKLKAGDFLIDAGEFQAEADTVLMATGAKALWLGLKSEERLRGKGVSACATCDGFFFREKAVAVVGGGDTALEEAQTLTKFAKKVYLIHRRSSFRASKIMQDRVFENKKIEVIFENEILEVLGDNRVKGVLLKNPFNAQNELNLDGIFVAIGHIPDTQLVKDIVALDDKGYILNSLMYGIKAMKDKIMPSDKFNPHFPTMTTLEGLFAAGDCVDHIYRQASVAAGMGVMASLDVERYLVEKG
jgi:thioredoxin reductase (NADPH)